MVSNIDFRVEQFEKFYDLLMSNAPEGYKPWFFPCEKNGKNPDTLTILKIDNSSKGSWHHESARLSKEQAIELIKQEHNIGISARENDALIIGDIDSPEYISQVPYTLTTTSRKRCGVHFFGWDKDGSAKKNIPTNDGELRSNNQYVLACGSYVPFNLENEKDKKAFNNLTDEAKNDKYLGYYTIRTYKTPERIGFEDLPQLYKNKENENLESDIRIKHIEENKEFKGEGKYSELFKLKVSDIIGAIPQKQRFGHPLHDSDTDANFSLSKDGTIGHCWRHLVSLNAVQFLCVKAGYMNCEDAGTPHGNRGLSKIKGDKKAYEVAYNEAIKMGLIKEWEGNKFDNNKRENIIYLLKRKEYGQASEIIVNEIKQNFKIYTTKDDKSNEVWIYENGIYVPNGKSSIKEFVRIFMGEEYNIWFVNQILSKIEADTQINPQDFFENNYINEIPVKNGILNIFTRELSPFNPTKIFFNKIQAEYNKDAKCPEIEKFLFSTLLTDKDVDVFYELGGSCLLKEYRFEKAFMFVGNGRNGKDKSLELIKRLLGIENCCSVPLSSLSPESFIISEFFGKMANIAGEISNQDLKDTVAFKSLTGRSLQTAPRKFLNPIKFVNYAKFIFACNDLPMVYDVSKGFWDRWVLLEFPYTFVTKQELESSHDKTNLKIRDENIIERITTADEMSGLLNHFLDGLDRLLKNKQFSSAKGSEEVKSTWIRKSNSVMAFCFNCVEEDSESWISKREFRKNYSDYCKKHKIPVKSDFVIKRTVEEMFGSTEGQKNIEMSWERVWEGIKWK